MDEKRKPKFIILNAKFIILNTQRNFSETPVEIMMEIDCKLWRRGGAGSMCVYTANFY